jgi:hypothetical protein
MIVVWEMRLDRERRAENAIKGGTRRVWVIKKGKCEREISRRAEKNRREVREQQRRARGRG